MFGCRATGADDREQRTCSYAVRGWPGRASRPLAQPSGAGPFGVHTLLSLGPGLRPGDENGAATVRGRVQVDDQDLVGAQLDLSDVGVDGAVRNNAEPYVVLVRAEDAAIAQSRNADRGTAGPELDHLRTAVVPQLDQRRRSIG